MGNIYHANAKTTVRMRKEIQASQETITELALQTVLEYKDSLKGDPLADTVNSHL